MYCLEDNHLIWTGLAKPGEVSKGKRKAGIKKKCIWFNKNLEIDQKEDERFNMI